MLESRHHRRLPTLPSPAIGRIVGTTVPRATSRGASTGVHGHRIWWSSAEGLAFTGSSSEAVWRSSPRCGLGKARVSRFGFRGLSQSRNPKPEPDPTRSVSSPHRLFVNFDRTHPTALAPTATPLPSRACWAAFRSSRSPRSSMRSFAPV